MVHPARVIRDELRPLYRFARETRQCMVAHLIAMALLQTIRDAPQPVTELPQPNDDAIEELAQGRGKPN
jgi:hypothetical protein